MPLPLRQTATSNTGMVFLPNNGGGVEYNGRKSVDNSSKWLDGHIEVNIGKRQAIDRTESPYPRKLVGSASISGTPSGECGVDMSIQ